MSLTRAQAEAALQNPNVIKFLNLISATEGTQKYGYATKFGGGQLSSLDDHPRYLIPFGKRGEKTSAAGRYQFLKGTWDEKAKQLGLTDFSPRNQDIAAVARIADRGALDALLKGDFNTAIAKTGKEWVSLPSGNAVGQPKRSMAFANKFLGTALPELPSSSMPARTPTELAAATVIPPTQLPAAQVAADPTEALRKIFDANARQNQSLAVTPPAPEDASLVQSQWADQLLQRAVSGEADLTRRNAIASFFNEPEIPDVEIPEGIDNAISRYLAMS